MLKQKLIEYLDKLEQIVKLIEDDDNYELLTDVIIETRRFSDAVDEALESESYSEGVQSALEDMLEDLNEFAEQTESYAPTFEDGRGASIWTDFISYYTSLVDYLAVFKKVV